MGRAIVFIHGAWVTPLCWEPFRGHFEKLGFECIAPAWPGKERPVEAIRKDPSPLLGLGIAEIADHYAEIIGRLDEPPILIGHSFGGLFVQILLDRGLGAAGVAIDPAPPKGVMVYEPTAIRSLASVLLTPRGWRKVVHWSYENFRYAFVHTLTESDARAAFASQVTPETGRIFFQDGLAAFDGKSPATVNFLNHSRAPLLIIAGEKDRIVPAAANRRNHLKYAGSKAVTDFHEFPGRTHWIIAQPGWEEVADHIHGWLAARIPGEPPLGPAQGLSG